MGEWLRGERSLEIAAAPARCLEVIADVEAYPEWQGMVEAIRVPQRDAQGRPRVVETVATTPVRTVRYAMRYDWEPPRRVRWRQVSGDLEDLEGSYELCPASGDGVHTTVTYRLGIVPGGLLGALMRSPLFPEVADWFMRQSLDELKRRCESRG